MEPLPLHEPRQHRWWLLKLGGQCFGLAAILLVVRYGELLGGGAEARMHVPFELTGICLAQLADIVALAALLFAILAPLWLTRCRPHLLLLIAVVMPPLVLFRLRVLVPALTKYHWIGTFFILWAMLVLLLRWRSAAGYRRLLRLGDFAGVFLFLFALGSVVQLLAVTRWKPGPYRHDADWESAATPRVHPKLVWIVFDELSYDQTFGNRAADLQLPNFDALRGQSTLFSNVQPAGDRTVKVLPSLLSGRRVDDYQFTFNNQWKVRFAGTKQWQRLDGGGSVFGDAQRLGWRTAAVGWYNPYCTVFSDAIEQCYAMNLDALDGSMSQLHSFWQNVVPAAVGSDLCRFEVQQRRTTLLDLTAHTESLLRADQADLVFIHLPVPHSPNLWNRHSQRFVEDCGSSYLDSLALADRTLGQILAELQRSPRWKDTTVIVQGDHSWRTYLWQYQPAWTAEDAAASSGGFDPRPAMLIHRAGQTTAATEDAPWPLLTVHQVVEQLLRQPRR